MVVLAMMFPVLGMAVAVAMGMLQYALTKSYPVLPSSFTLVDDVVVVVLFMRWLGSVSLGRARVPGWFSCWAATWLTFALVNVAASGLGASWSLEGLRSMFLPLMLYPIASEYAGRERALRFVLRVVVLVILVGAGAAIIQALASGAVGDQAYGLLGPGGANVLGFTALLGATILLSEPNLGPAQWAGVAVMLGALAASAARAALFVTPIALFLTLRGRPAKVMRLVIMIAIVAVGVQVVATVYSASGLDASSSLSPDALVRDQNNPNFGGRLLYAKALPKLFQQDALNWLTGLGPGRYTSAVGVQKMAPAYVAARPISTTTATGYANADSEWVTIVGEYGLVGLMCAVLILARPAYLALRAPLLLSLPKARQTLTRATPAIICIAVMAAFSSNAFEYQPFAYALWVLLGFAECEPS